MILIALGSNLASPQWGTTRETLENAAVVIAARGVHLKAKSRWYASKAVAGLADGQPIVAGLADGQSGSPDDNPDYVNGVMSVESDLEPDNLLTLLHEIESEFGRRRREKWAARTLDLDLLAYDDQVIGWPDNSDDADEGSGEEQGDSRSCESLILPHPRMQQRAFVLYPLFDVAPGWRHPVFGRTVRQMIGDLTPAERAVMKDNAPDYVERT